MAVWGNISLSTVREALALFIQGLTAYTSHQTVIVSLCVRDLNSAKEVCHRQRAEGDDMGRKDRRSVDDPPIGTATGKCSERHYGFLAGSSGSEIQPNEHTLQVEHYARYVR